MDISHVWIFDVIRHIFIIPLQNQRNSKGEKCLFSLKHQNNCVPLWFILVKCHVYQTTPSHCSAGPKPWLVLGSALCSPGPMFPGRVLCSPGPMFLRPYVPRVLCSPGLMLGGGGGGWAYSGKYCHRCCSSSSKFISNHTDIVIHIYVVIYSNILHIQNIWCDLRYTQ